MCVPVSIDGVDWALFTSTHVDCHACCHGKPSECIMLEDAINQWDDAIQARKGHMASLVNEQRASIRHLHWSLILR